MVKGREVLMYRGPAVEATVITEKGVSGTSVALRGLSKGRYEASFVYDGGKRYHGMGVLKAVKNINEIIAPALKGIIVTEQRKIKYFWNVLFPHSLSLQASLVFPEVNI